MCTGSLKVFFLAFSGQKNFAKGGCALSRAQNLFTALFVFLRRWGGFDPQKLPAVRFLRRWGGVRPEGVSGSWCLDDGTVPLGSAYGNTTNGGQLSHQFYSAGNTGKVAFSVTPTKGRGKQRMPTESTLVRVNMPVCDTNGVVNTK